MLAAVRSDNSVLICVCAVDSVSTSDVTVASEMTVESAVMSPRPEPLVLHSMSLLIN